MTKFYLTGARTAYRVTTKPPDDKQFVELRTFPDAEIVCTFPEELVRRDVVYGIDVYHGLFYERIGDKVKTILPVPMSMCRLANTDRYFTFDSKLLCWVCAQFIG